jgi:hypothetical protein
LKQGNSNCAKRYGNKVYCALHYSDISGIGTGGEEFMAKLKDFKRQSLGYAEARRKSSTTLSFPIPVQACPGSPYCAGWPHGIKPTSGYWIECRGGPSGVTGTVGGGGSTVTNHHHHHHGVGSGQGHEIDEWDSESENPGYLLVD